MNVTRSSALSTGVCVVCFVLFVKRSGVVPAGTLEWDGQGHLFRFCAVLNTLVSRGTMERDTQRISGRRERGDVLLPLRWTEGLWFS